MESNYHLLLSKATHRNYQLGIITAHKSPSQGPQLPSRICITSQFVTNCSPAAGADKSLTFLQSLKCTKDQENIC